MVSRCFTFGYDERATSEDLTLACPRRPEECCVGGIAFTGPRPEQRNARDEHEH
jgi:hypothetical protein